VTKFGRHDLVDWKANLRKEKEANIASMANGTEAPSRVAMGRERVLADSIGNV
jgi:hypothetical protein